MIESLRHWLSGLDGGFFLLLWAGAAGLTLLFVFLGFRYANRARIIAHTPTARLRSAAQGFNEIEGTGRPLNDAPLRSPLTFTPCVWYDVTVERREGSGRNSRWVTTERNRSDTLFMVDDGTGEAFVDPDHARVIEHRRRRWRERRSRTWYSGSSGTGFGGDDHRYTERLLLPGFPVYVLGWLETRGHRNTGESIAAAVEHRRRELLAEWQQDDEKRQRFDLDGDGDISEREWQWAMRLARSQAENEIREADTVRHQGSHTANLIRRPDNGDPYIISGLDQGALIRRKNRRAALFMAAAVVLFVFWFVAQTTRSPF
ncbi:GIDE domain-containing protein [Guyparkeria sp.]|uniref:GIDE domain-containing protein n=1 Tax=Guyparkeria sp. TaxID=2035736 RepID=UPI003563E162